MRERNLDHSMRRQGFGPVPARMHDSAYAGSNSGPGTV